VRTLDRADRTKRIFDIQRYLADQMYYPPHAARMRMASLQRSVRMFFSRLDFGLGGSAYSLAGPRLSSCCLLSGKLAYHAAGTALVPPTGRHSFLPRTGAAVNSFDCVTVCLNNFARH
jgi:hypothetical protein